MNIKGQQKAIEKILAGDNIFLTGGAGCVDKATEYLSPDGMGC